MTDTRLTLRQAAARLGVSESAIRKRVERGTLRSDKGEDGRRYVYLGAVADTVTDEVADASATHEPDALISEMRSRIQFLEDELQRKDAILLNMTEAMKALSPPREEAPEARESPVSPAPTDAPGPTPTEAQEGVRRPWWRRVFARRTEDA